MLPTDRLPDLWSEELEPSLDELAAIEAESPVIEAEVRLLDCELAILRAGRAGATALDWARVREAEREVLRRWIAYLSVPATGAEVA